jgi:hypothetical protein
MIFKCKDDPETGFLEVLDNCDVAEPSIYICVEAVGDCISLSLSDASVLVAELNILIEELRE